LPSAGITKKSRAETLDFNYTTVQKWKTRGSQPNSEVLDKLVPFLEQKERKVIEKKVKLKKSTVNFVGKR
jgi:hypothetical protein